MSSTGRSWRACCTSSGGAPAPAIQWAPGRPAWGPARSPPLPWSSVSKGPRYCRGPHWAPLPLSDESFIIELGWTLHVQHSSSPPSLSGWYGCSRSSNGVPRLLPPSDSRGQRARPRHDLPELVWTTAAVRHSSCGVFTGQRVWR